MAAQTGENHLKQFLKVRIKSASDCQKGARLANSFAIAFYPSPLFLDPVYRRFLKYWLPLLIWMSVIFSASTSLGSSQHTSRFMRPILLWLSPQMAEETIGEIHTIVRKTAHFVEYAFLGFLIWRVVASSPTLASWSTARIFGLALLLSGLYAASDETHQMFVPGREASVRDVLLDTCGAGFGLAAVSAALRVRKAIK